MNDLPAPMTPPGCTMAGNDWFLLAALGKTGRWGWDSTNPEIPVHMRETNRDWVRRALTDAKPEIADLLQAIERLEATLDNEVYP